MSDLVLILIVLWLFLITIRTFDITARMRHDKEMTEIDVEHIKEIINISEEHNHGITPFKDWERE